MQTFDASASLTKTSCVRLRLTCWQVLQAAHGMGQDEEFAEADEYDEYDEEAEAMEQAAEDLRSTSKSTSETASPQAADRCHNVACVIALHDAACMHSRSSRQV